MIWVNDLKLISIYSLTILLLLVPTAASAEVAKVIFITEPQSIAPDTLSEAITIQTVDSDGNEYKTTETLDLQFKSTSATGQFLNSSGNPASDYMSKNTAKRTFYYKDANAGNFTITVIANGRDSGKEWSAGQEISVGDALVAPSQASNSVSGLFSAGGSSSSKASASEPLEISAGGDRVVAVGSPINFQASIKKNSTGTAASLSWSFGDGGVASGQRVAHVYEYPGNYAVSLSAKAGDGYMVHRVKVKVIEPKLSLDLGEGYIEISNDAQNDLDLFNWKLVSGGKAFVFQPDTVILANSKIKISKSLLLLKGQVEMGTLLKNCLGQVVAAYEPPPAALAEIIPAHAAVSVTAAQSATVERVAVMDTEPELSPDVAEPAIVYQAPLEKGVISRVLTFFANIFK
jgi:hypothetical protein